MNLKLRQLDIAVSTFDTVKFYPCRIPISIFPFLFRFAFLFLFCFFLLLCLSKLLFERPGFPKHADLGQGQRRKKIGEPAPFSSVGSACCDTGQVPCCHTR